MHNSKTRCRGRKPGHSANVVLRTMERRPYWQTQGEILASLTAAMTLDCKLKVGEDRGQSTPAKAVL